MSPSTRPRALSCLLTAAFACTATPPEDDPFGGGIPPGATTGVSPSSDGDGSEGTNGADDGGSGGGVKLDVGQPDTDGNVGDGSSEGCEKVDFLFVIDASPSMEAEQAQLIASFPGFIDSIRDTLNAQDYQLLVTDVDAHPQYTPVGGNGFCDDGSCCATMCADDAQANWCNNEPCGDHSGDCDFMLGAGKDDDLDWSDCLLPQGRRWLDGNDAELLSHFECIARVGTYGHYDETQAAAVLSAVDPAADGATQCNDGFVRDDAVLVVTLISDEEDVSSPGDPQDWYEQLLALKGGNADAIVMLGLVGDFGQPASPCLPYDPMGTGAHDAQRMRAFVEAFGERGLLGSVCTDDYVPFFQQAVALIDDACNDFTPEG